MNLVSLLAQRALEHPERPALIDTFKGRERIVTFGELARRVNAGAAALRAMGLLRGQVALVFQPVSIELYEFLLAAFHSGIRVMLADPAAGRAFLTTCCARLVPDAYFGPWNAQCLRLATPALRGIRIPITSGSWFPQTQRWRTEGEGSPTMELPDDEPALITFTSGSTGMPKAAVRSHGFLLAQHRTLSRALDFEDGEVDLITLPVFVLANLASGLTSVLAATNLARPGSPDAAAIHNQCARHRVTRCTASPAFFAALMNSPTGLPPMRKIFTGGAPVYPDFLQRIRAAIPEMAIHAVYGSTEAEPIAHFSVADADAQTAAITRAGGGLCAGLPVPEISAMIIADHWGTALGPMNGDDFSALALPPGQAGEIVVSGAHVLRGYLNGIGDDETKIHVDNNVWHRTGDAGWFDPSGRLWLLGRCAEKLPPHPAPPGLPTAALHYPFAVECAMRNDFPNTRMAAITLRGQRTLIVGKLCQPNELATIHSQAATLGINPVICLKSLPMDRRHNAKIDYPALRKLLLAQSK